jgi:hypothetical protein
MKAYYAFMPLRRFLLILAERPSRGSHAVPAARRDYAQLPHTTWQGRSPTRRQRVPGLHVHVVRASLLRGCCVGAAGRCCVAAWLLQAAPAGGN